jgi:hypothetical protein
MAAFFGIPSFWIGWRYGAKVLLVGGWITCAAGIAAASIFEAPHLASIVSENASACRTISKGTLARFKPIAAS